jgi:hypothetical protein
MSDVAAAQMKSALENGKLSLSLINSEARLTDMKTMSIFIHNKTSRGLKAHVVATAPASADWVIPTQDADIPPGETISIPFRLKQENLIRFADEKFAASIEVEGRRMAVDKEIMLLPIHRMSGEMKIDGNLDKYRMFQPITLNTPANLFPSGEGLDLLSQGAWSGPEDLSMKVWVAYDEKCFYFAAEVMDDVFIQEHSGQDIWRGDGFQLAFTTQRSALLPVIHDIGYGPDDYEYGIALTKAGAQSYCWTTAEVNKHLRGPTPGIERAVVKAGEHVWHYELAIPWEYLKPLRPEPGRMFGFNFSYIDIDRPGGEVEYWMGLTDGIVGSKNPLLFKTFYLEEKQ